MSKPFQPQSGQNYCVIEAKFKEKTIYWTGNTPKSEKALKRTENDLWEWTEDIFKARKFETSTEAMECNFDLQINGTITIHIFLKGKPYFTQDSTL